MKGGDNKTQEVHFEENFINDVVIDNGNNATGIMCKAGVSAGIMHSAEKNDRRNKKTDDNMVEKNKCGHTDDSDRSGERNDNSVTAMNTKDGGDNINDSIAITIPHNELIENTENGRNQQENTDFDDVDFKRKDRTDDNNIRNGKCPVKTQGLTTSKNMCGVIQHQSPQNAIIYVETASTGFESERPEVVNKESRTKIVLETEVSAKKPFSSESSTDDDDSFESSADGGTVTSIIHVETESAPLESERPIVYNKDVEEINDFEKEVNLKKKSVLLSDNVMRNETWKVFTEWFREWICNFVVMLSVWSAKNPRRCVAMVIFLSLGTFLIGFLTNCSLNVDTEELFTPRGSRPFSHLLWIRENLETGDPSALLDIIIHANGKNILHTEAIEKMFVALDSVRTLPGYDMICGRGTYVYNGQRTCQISSVTRFWSYNAATFERQINNNLNSLYETLDVNWYPDGAPVDHGRIMAQYENTLNEYDNTREASAKTLSTLVAFPFEGDNADAEFEHQIVNTLLQLREDWASDPTSDIRMEFLTRTSYSDEFLRAILKDAPLIPCVFILMIIFSSLVFYKRNQSQSKSRLGFGGVLTIFLSIITSYGLLFICGVPLTPLTNVLPFIVFGIGLDDTFIIIGEYERQKPITNHIQRIRATMRICGLSISTTTATTSFAFVLGLMSTIPAIYWLCLYAFPLVIIDFFYQITFFVALVSLHEQGMERKKRNCCTAASRLPFVTTTSSSQSDSNLPWTQSQQARQTQHTQKTQQPQQTQQMQQASQPKSYEEQMDHIQPSQTPQKEEEHFADLFMTWYAKQLARPFIKVSVIVAFLVYLCFCIYATTLMRQEFHLTDLVPSDSYVKDFVNVLQTYSRKTSVAPLAYFRFVNQSDVEIQDQMLDFIDELVDAKQGGEDPTFCWIRDFRALIEADDSLNHMTFLEQVDFLLEQPALHEVYGNQIIREEGTKETIASRCSIPLPIDLHNVRDQIDFLHKQRAIAASQPINEGKEEWPFFTYDALYFLWEFYDVAVNELINTTISAIVAVTAIALVFVPHRSAILFLMPMMCMLYIDLIGTLQFIGVRISVISYISLVIAIGIMVDFIMHILLRYYESTSMNREEKVHEALSTMGSSIFLGGFSTFCSVIPLLFSTSAVLSTVFNAFFVMISLSLVHGLIFLPVVLSYIGPIETISAALTYHHTNVGGEIPVDESLDPPANEALRNGDV